LHKLLILFYVAATLDKAEDIASNIVKKIKKFSFKWDNRFYDIGVSIGIVPITNESDSTTQLLSYSDKACYTAKDRGRNQIVVYFSDDDVPARRYRDTLRAATLQDAIENDRFCLHAQVIMNSNQNSDGNVFYELLLRLKDENGQLLMPNEFIPAAERFKLMPAIDRWVIKNALSNYHMIFGRNSNAMISINLSGNSLSDKSLLSFILDLFKAHQVPTHRVCFEITETAAISNLNEATHVINVLKSQGCMIALDDFGSGLSSFRYLKQFPVDYLKIDGSFMQNIVEDSIDSSMVESINHIGKQMKIKTVAEWVEREDVLTHLKDIGIDYVQGFYLGKPIKYNDAGNDYGKRTGSLVRPIQIH